MLNANGSMNGSAAVGAASTSGTTVDYEAYWKDDFFPLKSAGKEVLKVLRRDESSPHGDLYRRILTTQSGSSTSGDSESLPNHHYFPDGKWSHVESIPLPQTLQDKLSSAKATSLMGLFPEAEMVWMSVDDTVYLWSYNKPGAMRSGSEAEFLYFQVPSKQPIVSVGLAPPKRGIFKEVVEWCLVVTTKEEALLCALARKEYHSLALVKTQFVIPTDWNSFLSVACTKDGRIFLGGQDGNLYELDYDMLVSSQYAQNDKNTARAMLDKFYDGNSEESFPAVIVENQSVASSILAQGKRALDNMINPSGQPARKCRKLNHSSAFTSTYVPEFVSKVANAIFGEATTTGGGPIIQMVVDEERGVLYTLSTRGWICVLDIADPKKIALAAVLNTPATAHLYLEAVSRGRMYAPATSNAKMGLLSFPGGGQGAQAGVGGMDGARRILKLAEQEKKNSRRQRNATSLLTPISIDVVPTHESTRLTLMAVSSGGLRYFLSSLTPNSLNAGPVLPPFGTPRSRHPWRPHSKVTLCHIRAPPPLSWNAESGSSSAPTVESEYRVDAACYREGTLFAAFQKANVNGGPTDNLLVVASADSKARITKKPKEDEKGAPTNHVPGGVCETVSDPMSRAGGPSRLPGGRVWEIRSVSPSSSQLLSLTLHSRTPSDAELGFGMAPVYLPPRKKGSNQNGRAVSGSRAISSDSTLMANKSSTSVAFTVMKNLLLSRPAMYGIDVKASMVQDEVDYSVYRLSNRPGSSGFSHSAADYKIKAPTSITRSARLSPWLLTPDSNPINPLAVQHIEQTASPYLALNAGGLHVFEAPSIFKQLASAILAARDKASSDSSVLDFFEKYGYSEGCAMCLLLAAKKTSGEELKQLAKSTALNLGYSPTMTAKSSSEELVSQDPWIPKEYSFTPSALYDGLTLAVARLLRPVWYKPAVVVTEGRIVRKGLKTATSPAKVELLLDDLTLEEIREPLVEIMKMMESVFSPAIGTVPLSKQASAGGDEMDIDEENFYLTRALEYQQSRQSTNSSFMMRPAEVDKLARRVEERNIHSLFRMVSRSVQCLSLLSHLRRAHSMPDLPEVQWGHLHGVSISQLVLSREGQERMETTLNALVTASTSISSSLTVSADALNLANLLSKECYHFFSKGSQHAYFGFHNAKMALNQPQDHISRRRELTARAVTEFEAAVSSWTSPSLITGRVLQTIDSENVSKIAELALTFDSPLAKACHLLVDLGSIDSMVNLCLMTAANFEKDSAVLSKRVLGSTMNLKYRWESGLYHTRQPMGQEENSSPAIGTSVTGQDAINTCYAIVFYHISRCLQHPTDSRHYELGQRIVSVCASYPENLAFQHKLFDHLLKEKHTDVLLGIRMDSPILENWLAEKKTHFDLLLSYYHIHGKFMARGDAAFSCAVDDRGKLTLDERIEYLVHAVDAYATVCRRQMSLDQAQQKWRQSAERLQIARVQSQVLQAMTSTKYETTPEILDHLQTKLLTANELMNQYAMPHDMFEFCLVLLHVCNFRDETQIEKFWKSLFCEEIFPCSTRDVNVYRALRSFADGAFIDEPSLQLLEENESSSLNLFEDGVWMANVERALVRLGKELLPQVDDLTFEEPTTFPLAFVLSHLEELRALFVSSSDQNTESTMVWSYATLTAAGFRRRRILECFDQLFEADMKFSMGNDSSTVLEQIRTTISIYEVFIKEARDLGGGVGNQAYKELSAFYASGEFMRNIEAQRARMHGIAGDVHDEERRLSTIVAVLRQLFP